MKTRMIVSLLCLWAVLWSWGCDPGLHEFDSDVKTLDVVLTPKTASRRFTFTLKVHKDKDVDWVLQKLLTSVKYTFQTRDAANPNSAHVEIKVGLPPTAHQSTDIATFCFDDASRCTWQTKDIDLQKNYTWHLDHTSLQSQKVFITVKLVSGAPVKGKLEIDTRLSVEGASPEEVDKTHLLWSVEEVIVE